jgi:hypothetical protein
MKFTLTYDGPLPASANKPKNSDKWDIRQKIHPQLVDLWASHPALQHIERDERYFPKGGTQLTQRHHLDPGPIHPALGPISYPTVATQHDILREMHESGNRQIVDLCEPIERHGAWFKPLVRGSFALHCGLRISFLRKEPPGRVYQGGDLDGRIKTLLDALEMPQHVEQVLDKSSTRLAPIYCLMEEDVLVSGLTVESERLLTDQNYPADYVRLNIEVDVRVRQAMIYNQSFLG